MPKKSFKPKVGDFILTVDNYHGIIIKIENERGTVRYFDDEPIYADEFFGDTVQEFPLEDIVSMHENFLKSSKVTNVKHEK